MTRRAVVAAVAVLSFWACSGGESGDQGSEVTPGGTGGIQIGTGSTSGSGTAGVILGTGGSGAAIDASVTGGTSGSGGGGPSDAATDQPISHLVDGGCLGQVLQCTCDDGATGWQRCNTLGINWLPCECTAAVDAGGCSDIGEQCGANYCCTGHCPEIPPFVCCWLTFCSGTGGCCNGADCTGGTCCSNTGRPCRASADCCNGTDRCVSGTCQI